MQMKYLSLALVAAMATTGLTACGGDSDDNYGPPDSTPSTPDTGGNTGGDTGGNTGGDTGGNTGGDTGGDTGGNTGGDSTDTGAGGATTGQVGFTDSGQVVAATQYIRSDDSNFDTVAGRNTDRKNNADATLLADLTLQNKKMTNIVVGAEVVNGDDKNDENDIITKRYVGEDVPEGQENPASNEAIQNTNKDFVNVNGDSFAASTKNNGLVAVSVDKVLNSNGGATYQTSVSGIEQDQTTPSRFFGSYHLNTDNTENVNSHFYAIRNAEGKDITGNLEGKVSTTVPGTYSLDSSKMKLQNVQYGRVTSDIEPLDDATIKTLVVQDGQSYYDSKFKNKGSAKSVDTYFYRGLNETQKLPTTGKFEYAGHALMYGIDNSFHGKGGNGGKSNSFTRGAERNALGNFVQASVDFDARKVEGEVYNIWLADRNQKKAIKDSLVTFKGDIGKANSVNGNAKRTYADGDASFHASFYGKNATEMGGSFNSVTDKQKYGNVDNEGGFTNKSGWGGVFGAKQLEKANAPDPTPNPDNGAIAQ